MGHLVEGQWIAGDGAATDKDGRFIRRDAQFRDWVRADSGAEYPAAKDRYHLYVSYACPWACRTLVFRALKKLESIISVSVVHPDNESEGWVFAEYPDATVDHIHGSSAVHELYSRAKPDYTGRATVPILWDTVTSRIVNNESSEIIRMFNTAFDAFTDAADDFYPEDLRDVIDAVNERVYHTVNNGVYRAGFASSQAAYDEAVTELFDTLDWLEERLESQRYLAGDRITEADWRLLTTLVRFDAVYVTHFKCNIRRLVDYPNLLGYTRELMQVPGVAATVHLDHIKRHYFGSHRSINPKGIVAAGFDVDWNAPHGRG